ncbi:MAG: zinc ABC transporter substrate-binding protein [Candidatus Lernaella stagnicola]|nr:zinc ABC transporter substrate-binding protein [Candidatus Lernaella stagnicola]
MTQKAAIWSVMALLLCLGVANAAAAPLEVFVSIVPQKYFVERVGGEEVSVAVLVGPGRSPATYDPTPAQMARLSRAAVLFRIGVPFENRLMTKIPTVCPNLRIVDTRRGVKLLAMEEDHGHDDGHDHAGMDPHIWLDPKRVKVQARTIAESLSELRPAAAATFRANLAAFERDLDEVDARIGRVLAPFRGRSFMVFHPSYGYFGDSYGLVQIAVEASGKSPGPRQIARWVDWARAENIRIVFVQPQFASSAVHTIAQSIDGAVVPMDPLAEDYLTNLEAMARRIEEALGDSERP